MKICVGLGVLLAAIMGAAGQQQICEQFGFTHVANKFVVMNNRWGTDAPHCIEVHDDGFKIVRQDGVRNDSPVYYPAIFYGCHWTNCSPNTKLPLKVKNINHIKNQISFNYVDGKYDAAFDIWLDPQPNTWNNNAMEIMIWTAREQGVQPIGAPVGNTQIADKHWEVWTGTNGVNQVISYVTTTGRIHSMDFNVMAFVHDAKDRGFYNGDWYLTSIQAGFEPWAGGVGLAVKSFHIEVDHA